MTWMNAKPEARAKATNSAMMSRSIWRAATERKSVSTYVGGGGAVGEVV
jgi:hypothetical protein